MAAVILLEVLDFLLASLHFLCHLLQRLDALPNLEFARVSLDDALRRREEALSGLLLRFGIESVLNGRWLDVVKLRIILVVLEFGLVYL